jgi:ligand-binding sensor domain-containing protein
MTLRTFPGLIALLLVCVDIAWGANNRFSIHPDNRIDIRSITGGPCDSIWLAARDGLYRFDGLHYHRIPEYPFQEASHIASTADGALWIGSGQGLVRFAGKFEVIIGEPVLGLAANGDEVFVSTPNRFSRVRGNGSITEIGPKGHFRLTTDDAGNLYYVIESDVYVLRKGTVRADRLMGVPKGLRGSDWQVVPGAGGSFWFGDGWSAVANKAGGAEQLQRDQSPGADAGAPVLVRGRGSHVWLLSRFPRRLDPPAEFRSAPAVPSAAVPRSGYEDEWGRFWADLPGVGLLEEIPDPTWERWGSKYFEGKSVSCTVRDARGELIAAMPRSGLWKLNASGSPPGKWELLRRDVRRYRSVLPLPDGTLLASDFGTGIAHLSAAGRLLQQVTHTRDPGNDYGDLLRDRAGNLWIGNDASLFRLEEKPGSFFLRPVDLHPGAGRAHVTDLELDSTGRPWAGYALGVARMSADGRWERITTNHRVEYVVALAFGGAGTGDEIWVAYQDGKRLGRLLRSGTSWEVTELAEALAGTAPVTVFLHRDSRGWLWRGTKRGVYVSDGRHVAPHEWLRLDVDTGLASGRMNPFGFFEDADRTVWLSGEDGITHLRPDLAWFEAPASAPRPRITRVEADGQSRVVLESLPDRFPSGLRTLRIDAGSLRPQPFRDAPFLYRLLPLEPEWQPMSAGTLELRNPRDNTYRLEISHAGPAPHPMLVYTFRTGAVPARLPWALVIGGSGAVAIGLSVLRRSLLFQRASYKLLKLAHELRLKNLRTPVDTETSETAHKLCGQVMGGHYIVVRPISYGGFSAVFEARDERDRNTPLALKVFHRRVNESSWVKERFAQEVAALRGINHAGVVSVLDCWVHADGRPCLIMPLLPGPTLRDALAPGPMAPKRVSRLIAQVGEALSEIHARGIVHRDLKPENILLVPDPADQRAVLIDFGNAGLVGMEEGLGYTELLTGSIHYMAPEQLTKHYSAASDVYSFGVIILEILTGKRLSHLNNSVVDSGFVDELVCLLSFRLPGDVTAFARKLAASYSPDPAQRPGRVAEWANDLARMLNPGDSASS